MTAVMAPDRLALDVSGLTATVGAFRLGPVDLAVRPGQTCCLLGANGAGKTTLLRRLLSLIPGAVDRLTVAGTEARRRDPAWLRLVGVVPDDPTELLEELTAEEYWELVASTYTVDRHERAEMLRYGRWLASSLGFDPPTRVQISTYSHGMRKKTQLVAALLHRPRLLVVDEPRNGLDPAGIAAMERLLARQCALGGAVLAATHDLYWADRIANRVVILSGGSVVLNESTHHLRGRGLPLPQVFFSLTGAVPEGEGGAPRAG